MKFSKAKFHPQLEPCYEIWYYSSRPPKQHMIYITCRKIRDPAMEPLFGVVVLISNVPCKCTCEPFAHLIYIKWYLWMLSLLLKFKPGRRKVSPAWSKENTHIISIWSDSSIIISVFDMQPPLSYPRWISHTFIHSSVFIEIN